MKDIIKYKISLFFSPFLRNLEKCDKDLGFCSLEQHAVKNLLTQTKVCINLFNIDKQ